MTGPPTYRKMIATVLKNIRNLRISKGLSQQNIADHLNINQSSYARIERGDTAITLEHLIKICECMETDINTIFRIDQDSVAQEVNKNSHPPYLNHSEIKDIRIMLRELQDLRRKD